MDHLIQMNITELTQYDTISAGRNKCCFLKKEGSGTYNSHPGKERARELVSRCCWLSQDLNHRGSFACYSKETAPHVPAIQRCSCYHFPSTFLCAQQCSHGSAGVKDSRIARALALPNNQHCKEKQFSHPQQIPVLPVSEVLADYID